MRAAGARSLGALQLAIGRREADFTPVECTNYFVIVAATADSQDESTLVA
jgi:hypothetical protein